MMFSLVKPLLARWYRDLQAILWQRQRAGGVRCVSAGRIVRSIEIEPKIARLRQAVAGQLGIEKPARAVGFGLARGVAQDKEQLLVAERFYHRLQAQGLAVEREFRRA